MSGAGAAGAVSVSHAGHCGSGVLRDLLDWARLDWGGQAPGEGLVFGLGAGLGFSCLRCRA